MEINEIREKILTDDDFVLSEVEKIQYLYGLKHEIRYDLVRPQTDHTESVAEHVYGMHIISDYFLPLEDPEGSLDVTKIKTMISWHDMDELETGDTVSWKKSAKQIAQEETAWKAVVPRLPELLRDTVTDAVAEYEALESPEAVFVKGIDKIEPLFQMYGEHNRDWVRATKQTRANSESIKIPYLTELAFMRRFTDVVHDSMESQGHFID